MLLTTIIVTYHVVVWVLLSMFSIFCITSFRDSPTTPARPLLYRLFQAKAERVASLQDARHGCGARAGKDRKDGSWLGER